MRITLSIKERDQSLERKIKKRNIKDRDLELPDRDPDQERKKKNPEDLEDPDLLSDLTCIQKKEEKL